MDKWYGIIIPIVVSVISSIFAFTYFAGRNVERVKMFEDDQEMLKLQILELIQRVSKLEGKNEAGS